MSKHSRIVSAGLTMAVGLWAFAVTPAQAVDCMAPPPSDQDLTLIAAYAASPPAVDEVAFSMEVENIMYNTYGGDLLQYVSVWYPEHKTCGAGTNLEGEKQVTGRWAESWESSENGTIWKFKLKKGIKSHVGNEMTCEDHRWSWERGFEMKSVKYFFTKVMGIEKHEDVSCPDPYTVQFKIKAANPLFLQMLAMNYLSLIHI
mgnify:FL=1